MINTAFRALLTSNATSLLVIIFIVQKGYSPGHCLNGVTYFGWTVALPNAVSYLFYLAIPRQWVKEYVAWLKT